MSFSPFEVVWDYPALHAFCRLPIHSAYMLDRALRRFAERGEGHIERVPPYVRLRAGLYDIALVIDAEQQTITVIRFFRAR